MISSLINILFFYVRFDQLAVLTESDAKEFETNYKIPVYLVSNVYSNLILALCADNNVYH